MSVYISGIHKNVSDYRCEETNMAVKCKISANVTSTLPPLSLCIYTHVQFKDGNWTFQKKDRQEDKQP